MPRRVDIETRLTGDDQVRRGLDNLQEGIRGIDRGAKESATGVAILAGAVGGFAGGMVAELTNGVLNVLTAIPSKAFESALQVEEANHLVIAVLRNVGDTAGITKKEIDDLAESMQSATRFDDKSIKMAAAELLNFENVQGRVFKEALALSADLAERLGTDIPNAARILGMSLQNPERATYALRSARLVLSETERDYIKALMDLNRTTDAQEFLLNKLKGTLSGTAAIMNTELSRAVNDLKDAWNDLNEEIGKSGSGAAEAGLRGVTYWLNQMKSTMQGDWVDRLSLVAKFAFPAYGIASMFSSMGKGGEFTGKGASGTWGAPAGPTDQQMKDVITEAEKKEVKGKTGGGGDPLARQVESTLAARRQALAFVERETEVERTLYQIREGAYRKFPEAAKQELLLIAEKLDLLKSEEQRRKDLIGIESDQLRADKRRVEEEARAAERRRNELAGEVESVRAMGRTKAEIIALRQKEVILIYQESQALGEQALTMDELQAAMASIHGEAEKQIDMWDELRDAIEGYSKDMAGMFVGAMFQGGDALKNFGDLLNDLARTVSQIITQRLVTDPLTMWLNSAIDSVLGGGIGNIFGGGGGGGGGVPIDFSAIGGPGIKLPGFQDGGDFTIGGIGGPDSQLVAFRGTPGERVTVSKSGQRQIVVNNHFNISGQTDEWSQRQIAAAVYSGMVRAAKGVL